MTGVQTCALPISSIGECQVQEAGVGGLVSRGRRKQVGGFGRENRKIGRASCRERVSERV